MTATINESATAAPAAGGVGRVSRVIGPVVDVEFSADTMPEVYNLLTLEVSLNGEKKNINLEVAQHIGDSMVRAISLQPTDGIVRGSEVRDSGGPIVSVSPETSSCWRSRARIRATRSSTPLP